MSSIYTLENVLTDLLSDMFIEDIAKQEEKAKFKVFCLSKSTNEIKCSTILRAR